jgi:V/A-type H+-transporting ATPase subunit I
MLRPEDMTRAVIVGSIDSLDATIDCLYELGVLHLIDFTQQDQDFKIGQPLPKASASSQKLLKLRSIIRALNIEEHKPKDKMLVSDITKRMEQALVTLDLNTHDEAEERQKIQALIRQKEGEIRLLSPIQDFAVPVEDYDGFDNISTFVGTCKNDPTVALYAKIAAIEMLSNPRKSDVVVAVFVRNEDKTEALRILTEHDFQEAKLPKLKGDPRGIIARNESEIADLRKDVERIEKDIEAIRKKFADFIISSEEHLAIEVLKAETPLRMASTANSFVIDGWIPSSRMSEIKRSLDSFCAGLVHMESVPREKEDEPPVKLKNSKLVKPFEFFINLVSTPKYEEIDPTLILFITFPLFFGFMIGDLGFGIGLLVLGGIMRFKLKNSPDLQKLGTIVMAGGLMASVFGLFVFAEAFGVPFHPPEANPEEYSWESLANIPIHPALDKMHDITEMLAISLFAGWLHLTLGFIFGFVNTIHHNKKHAVAKIAWLIVLFGLFVELMTIAGGATRTSDLINSGLQTFLPAMNETLVGVEVSLPAVAMIVVGIVVLPITEGAIALTEVLGLFTNIMSYMRLAALATGKGAVAMAFNTMFFPLIFESGNIVLAILGVVMLVIAQTFFVFILGALSAGIQAIRLNYVEFFLKFYEGGGTDFSPLKYERKYSVATK